MEKNEYSSSETTQHSKQVQFRKSCYTKPSLISIKVMCPMESDYCCKKRKNSKRYTQNR